MNCDQVNPQLTAYLHHQVTPSEGEIIQNHLAGCAACRQILEDLMALDYHLTTFYQIKAGSVYPTPLAWEGIRRRLGQKRGRTKGMVSTEGKSRLVFGKLGEKRSFKQLVIALTVLLLILLAPPAWALAGQLREWLNPYYNFKVQELEAGIRGFEAFIPYYPTYLPKGFSSLGMGGNTGPDWDQLELTFSRRDRFVTLLQSVGLKENGLFNGEPVNINGWDVIYIPDFANSIEELHQVFPNVSITTDFDYSNLDLLTWYIDDIQVDLITNLPFGESLKIAKSLKVMDSSAEP